MGWLSGRGLLRLVFVAVVAAGGYYGWEALQPASLPPGFAGGNGRIEGTEIDVATKIPGRIREILVNEGDFVAAGEVLARMDAATLEAQLREARARLQRAEIAVQTARNQVTQREAEKAAADAVLRQRQVEQDAARRRYERTEELAARGNAPQQTLDDDRARLEGARAAESAARAQIAAAEAAIGFARSQVIGAGAEVEAMRASVERIEADIDDSALRAPRDGRVQYRISQVGEVLGAGGRVLSLIDLADVYMTFFLPTAQAGRVAQDAEARIVLDAAPEYVIPASISFVASVAQFTPRTVETEEERLKLMFRVRARIAPELLRQHRDQVKVGLPGMAYVRLDPQADWPAALQARLPQ